MPDLAHIARQLFNISNPEEFNVMALEIFRYQYASNAVYADFVDQLSIYPKEVGHFTQVPFLPVSFFKSHLILSGKQKVETQFRSSGTTGSDNSRHAVVDTGLYRQSFLKGFTHFFGNIEEYTLLALLPSYLEKGDSSLIFMVDELIKRTGKPESGFFLDNLQKLHDLLAELRDRGEKVMLIGVTYALLDLAEQYPLDFPALFLMETGGMKGRRKEMVREEVHLKLKEAFGLQRVYSEYGMTELLSQAYSMGDGLFLTPPWMKVLIRDANDPLTLNPEEKTGGINIIDLANLHSCSFIATQDLGKLHLNGKFEVLGRFDHSDVRGCNLMVD
jgi:hypothetical protein